MPGRVEQADFVVDSAEVAELLRSPIEVKHLLMFLRPHGLTVTAFAEAAGLTVNRAFRKVQQLERLGLLTIDHEERRAGRPVKHYRCPFRSFLIPSTWVSLEEQIGDVFEPMRALMVSSLAQAASEGSNPVKGMIMTVTPDGLWMLPANAEGKRWDPQQPGTPAYLHDCGPLYLNYDDAKELQKELNALFDRYRLKRGSTTYLLHQFLTPVSAPAVPFVFPHAGYTDLV